VSTEIVLRRLLAIPTTGRARHSSGGGEGKCQNGCLWERRLETFLPNLPKLREGSLLQLCISTNRRKTNWSGPPLHQSAQCPRLLGGFLLLYHPRARNPQNKWIVTSRFGWAHCPARKVETYPVRRFPLMNHICRTRLRQVVTGNKSGEFVMPRDFLPYILLTPVS